MRPVVEAIFDGAQLGVGDGAEVEAARQVLSSQAVDVLVAAALPGHVGIGEEEIGLQCDADERVFGKLLAVVGGQGMHPGDQAAQALQQGARDAVGGAIRRPGQQVQTAAAFGHRDHDRRAARGVDGVEFPIARARAGFDHGWALMQAAPMPELTASVAQPAAAALTPALPQPSKQPSTAALVGVDVPVDPLVARQAGDGRDLLRAPVLQQVRLDSGLVLGGDAGTRAGCLSAAPGKALGPLGLIAPVHTVAPHLPADGARCAIELKGDAAQRAARVTQGADSVSFMLVQAALGHEQLHLAVKGLRLGHLNLFSISGVAFQS